MVIRASVSPITAQALLKVAGIEQVERMVRYIPDDATRALVKRELAELSTVAQIRFDKGTPTIQSVSAPAPSVAPVSEWISTSEAAQILGKSTMTVRRYIEAGAVESKRKDKKSFLVLRESVEALNLGKHAAA
ncbi:hypothetical protein ACT17S_00325 [Glutamicibacter mysorens]